MVTAYVPEVGDIAVIDFDPQVGHEQAKRRPALVLTDRRYNRASGLAIVCPLTSRRKPYPFALPIKVDNVEGAVSIRSKVSIGQAARLLFIPELNPPWSRRHGNTSPCCLASSRPSILIWPQRHPGKEADRSPDPTARTEHSSRRRRLALTYY